MHLLLDNCEQDRAQRARGGGPNRGTFSDGAL